MAQNNPPYPFKPPKQKSQISLVFGMNALVPLGTILKLYLTLFFTSGMKRLHSMRYFGYHSWREIINTSTNMIIFSLTPKQGVAFHSIRKQRLFVVSHLRRKRNETSSHKCH